MKNNSITEDLLIKYVANGCTEFEKSQVELWAVEKSEHKKLLEQYRFVYNHPLHQPKHIDTDVAWQNFKHRIDQSDQSVEKKLSMRKMFGIAASIIMMISFGVYWYYFIPVIQISGDQIATLKMPDGSDIILNKNSKISYSRNFKTNRKLELKGEAFFEVVKDPQHPFEIITTNGNVAVLGTSFNVRAGSNATEVIVETGLVKVVNDVTQAELKPGDRSTIQKESKTISVNKVSDSLYNYYRTQTFICNNTPLWRLVDVLNREFNTNYKIEMDEIKNLEITATFKNEKIENILSIVAETLSLKIDYQNQIITIR